MDFKLWLCIEEIFRHLSAYAIKLSETTNLAQLMGAEEINSLIQNITGVRKHYLQILLGQARRLAKTGVSPEELANIAVAKIWKEKDVLQNKIKTVRDTGKKLPTKQQPNPETFENQETMDDYISMLVIRNGVNGMLEFQKSDGQRSLTYFFNKLSKAVKDGKPFSGFIDNEEAKKAFIAKFSNTGFDNQLFARFLADYGHNKAHDIAARSLVHGKASEEGEVSGRSITAGAAIGDDLFMRETKDDLKRILGSMLASATSDVAKRNIENAIKFVDVLDMAQQGHGWKVAAGAEIGVTDPNLIFAAFLMIKKAAERLEGSDFMKDQIKSLTQDAKPAPTIAPASAPSTPMPSTSMSSSMRPDQGHDDQGHDARLGF